VAERPDRSARALRWSVAGLRHLVLDVAPAVALVAVMVLLAFAVPWLGGPGISPPAEHFDLPGTLASSLVWGLLALLVALLLSRTRAVWRRATGRSATLSRPFPAAGRFLMRAVARALAMVGGLIVVRLAMPVFVGFKRAIPDFQPYGPWDTVFVQADRLLHFGADPWLLLHPLLGRPWITAALDSLYFGWYLVSVLGFVALAFCTRGPQRVRFIFAFCATWVALGVIVATATASVGPCYLDAITGADTPFSPLMAYLADVDAVRPLHALAIQAELWSAHEQGARTLASGIAAMPSLHVAIPALFAVAAWHRSRAAAVGLWVYTFLIFLGSVHLGWHYAVDGYVAVALIVAVWGASGWVARRWYARTRRFRWGWAQR